MDLTTTISNLVTGPVAAVVLTVMAVYKLWTRIEKMIDQMQTLVTDNTKAMAAMTTSSEAQTRVLERVCNEVHALQNGASSREVSQPNIRIGAGA